MNRIRNTKKYIPAILLPGIVLAIVSLNVSCKYKDAEVKSFSGKVDGKFVHLQDMIVQMPPPSQISDSSQVSMTNSESIGEAIYSNIGICYAATKTDQPIEDFFSAENIAVAENFPEGSENYPIRVTKLMRELNNDPRTKRVGAELGKLKNTVADAIKAVTLSAGTAGAAGIGVYTTYGLLRGFMSRGMPQAGREMNLAAARGAGVAQSTIDAIKKAGGTKVTLKLLAGNDIFLKATNNAGKSVDQISRVSKYLSKAEASAVNDSQKFKTLATNVKTSGNKFFGRIYAGAQGVGANVVNKFKKNPAAADPNLTTLQSGTASTKGEKIKQLQSFLGKGVAKSKDFCTGQGAGKWQRVAQISTCAAVAVGMAAGVFEIAQRKFDPNRNLNSADLDKVDSNMLDAKVQQKFEAALQNLSTDVKLSEGEMAAVMEIITRLAHEPDGNVAPCEPLEDTMSQGVVETAQNFAPTNNSSGAQSGNSLNQIPKGNQIPPNGNSTNEMPVNSGN